MSGGSILCDRHSWKRECDAKSKLKQTRSDSRAFSLRGLQLKDHKNKSERRESVSEMGTSSKAALAAECRKVVKRDGKFSMAQAYEQKKRSAAASRKIQHSGLGHVMAQQSSSVIVLTIARRFRRGLFPSGPELASFCELGLSKTDVKEMLVASNEFSSRLISSLLELLLVRAGIEVNPGPHCRNCDVVLKSFDVVKGVKGSVRCRLCRRQLAQVSPGNYAHPSRDGTFRPASSFEPDAHYPRESRRALSQDDSLDAQDAMDLFKPLAVSSNGLTDLTALKKARMPEEQVQALERFLGETDSLSSSESESRTSSPEPLGCHGPKNQSILEKVPQCKGQQVKLPIPTARLAVAHVIRGELPSPVMPTPPSVGFGGTGSTIKLFKPIPRAPQKVYTPLSPTKSLPTPPLAAPVEEEAVPAVFPLCGHELTSVEASELIRMIAPSARMAPALGWKSLFGMFDNCRFSDTACSVLYKGEQRLVSARGVAEQKHPLDVHTLAIAAPSASPVISALGSVLPGLFKAASVVTLAWKATTILSQLATGSKLGNTMGKVAQASKFVAICCNAAALISLAGVAYGEYKNITTRSVRAENLFVHYSPHMVSSYLLDNDRHVNVDLMSSNIRAQSRRLACLPIPDHNAMSVITGSECAALACARLSGNHFFAQERAL